MPVGSSTGSTTCQPPAPSSRTRAAAAAAWTSGSRAGDQLRAAAASPSRPATCASALSNLGIPVRSRALRPGGAVSRSCHSGATAPKPDAARAAQPLAGRADVGRRSGRHLHLPGGLGDVEQDRHPGGRAARAPAARSRAGWAPSAARAGRGRPARPSRGPGRRPAAPPAPSRAPPPGAAAPARCRRTRWPTTPIRAPVGSGHASRSGQKALHAPSVSRTSAADSPTRAPRAARPASSAAAASASAT